MIQCPECESEDIDVADSGRDGYLLQCQSCGHRFNPDEALCGCCYSIPCSCQDIIDRAAS